MFETLSENLSHVFDRLTGRGVLSEKDVDAAFSEVRKALLEADVALPVVQYFLEQVRPQTIGADVLKSVKPGQQVIKIVHDALLALLGEAHPISLQASAPIPMMLVGLQGAGKTTSTAKIAQLLTTKEKCKILMASLDTARPAAMEQLRILGEQAGIATLPIVEGQNPSAIAVRAMEAGRLGGYDVVLLDTAGRSNTDAALMAELTAIEKAVTPHETLLVADSLTGQEAVTIAAQFHAHVSLTGIVLTRTEGDGRGGAALSMRHVTGVPIKLLGTGEGLDAIESFDAGRIANKILGMGDVVGLVEKAAATMDTEKAEKIAARMKKGIFTLDDMAEQLLQMRKMGGMSGILGMLPGMGKLKKQAGAQLGAMGMDDDRVLLRQAAIVSSMTQAEKDNPKVLNASRKKRVAAGSGTCVQDVNKLVKMHRQMADMMKKMGKGGMKGLMGAFGDMGDAMPDVGQSMGQAVGKSMGQAVPDFDALKKQFGSSQELPSGLGLPRLPDGNNFQPKKK